jgi:small neutral amino acid transporter SnatA (MarC family)
MTAPTTFGTTDAPMATPSTMANGAIATVIGAMSRNPARMPRLVALGSGASVAAGRDVVVTGASSTTSSRS